MWFFFFHRFASFFFFSFFFSSKSIFTLSLQSHFSLFVLADALCGVGLRFCLFLVCLALFKFFKDSNDPVTPFARLVSTTKTKKCACVSLGLFLGLAVLRSQSDGDIQKCMNMQDLPLSLPSFFRAFFFFFLSTTQKPKAKSRERHQAPSISFARS